MTAGPLFSGAPEAPPPVPPVEIVPGWLPDHERALRWFEQHLPWVHQTFRPGVPMPRLECLLGPSGRTYTYSGITYRTHPLEGHPVRRIVDRANSELGAGFNAVFANLYRDGKDSIGWHADDEESLGPAADVCIASVSVGVRRRFRMRHPATGTTAEWLLGHGDLLVMRPGCQVGWVHCAPKQPEITGARVVLTLRRLL